jgi:hypothetical protein
LPYAARVKELLDSFWRAAAYCVHPRVILWSLLPLLLAAGLVAGLGWFYWDAAVSAVRAGLEQWSSLMRFVGWLDSFGLAAIGTGLAPFVVVLLAVPLIVVLSLLLVAWLMTPALVRLVHERRFADLQRKHGAGWWGSALWSLGYMLVALLLLVLSLPLWLIPPLVLVLPPLIWGWLTYKVMSFDVLAEHASGAERRLLIREQRWPLLTIGVTTGYLGAAPALLWAFSAATLVLAPVLVLTSLWLYTAVFAFSSLWFAHFALQALRVQRLRDPPTPLPPVAEVDAIGTAAPPVLPPP